LAVDLLQNGTTCVATTRNDRKGYPNEEINKDSVVGFNRGMTYSTTLDGKVHCLVWLDARPVFFIDTELGRTVHNSVSRTLASGSSICVPCPLISRVLTINVWSFKSVACKVCELQPLKEGRLFSCA